MAITLNGSIALPDLFWSDEFAWTPVSQVPSRTESGLLVIEEGQLVAGRPITLQGGADHGFAPRSLVASLYALAQTAAASPMSLLLNDGRTFSVIWRRESNASPIEAVALWPYPQPTDTDQFSLTLRLLTV